MKHDIQAILSIPYPVRSSGYVMDKISWYDLYQCFSAKYSRNLRIPRKIVEQININSEIPQKVSKYLSKYRGNLCPAIGNTGIISVHYQLSLLFCFCSSYLMLHVVVVCLYSFRIVTDPPHRLPQQGEPPWEKQQLGYLQIYCLDNNLAAFELRPPPHQFFFLYVFICGVSSKYEILFYESLRGQ